MGMYKIWQYHDENTQSGIVMAFRRSNSPFDTVKIKLKGLLKDKKYTYKNLNDNTLSEGDNQIIISLPEKRSSVIIEYKKK